MKLGNIRQDYHLSELSEAMALADPVDMFEGWFNHALSDGITDANAMTLATSDTNGYPSARIVLLKHFDARGFIFFTNYDGRKGRELDSNPHAALLFFWKEMERQVRIEGIIEKTKTGESEKYFNERSLESRISAVVSPQSQIIPNRKFLEEKWDELAKGKSDKAIQRPDNWGGYRLRPDRFEFWQGRANRLHDRLLYELIETNWEITRLAP